jgi:hypothetical protein
MPEPDEQKVCAANAKSYLFYVFLYLFNSLTKKRTNAPSDLNELL